MVRYSKTHHASALLAPDAEGYAPIHRAALGGHLHVVKFLINN